MSVPGQPVTLYVGSGLEARSPVLMNEKIFCAYNISSTTLAVDEYSSIKSIHSLNLAAVKSTPRWKRVHSTTATMSLETSLE